MNIIFLEILKKKSSFVSSVTINQELEILLQIEENRNLDNIQCSLTYPDLTYPEYSLIRNIHLSGHLFGNQFLNGNWLTYLEIQLSGQLVWERRCPDKWGSTVPVRTIKTGTYARWDRSSVTTSAGLYAQLPWVERRSNIAISLDTNSRGVRPSTFLQSTSLTLLSFCVNNKTINSWN